MFHCDICGEHFDYPFIREYNENQDGENGIEHRREEYCPKCGAPIDCTLLKIVEDDL